MFLQYLVCVSKLFVFSAGLTKDPRRGAVDDAARLPHAHAGLRHVWADQLSNDPGLTIFRVASL